MATRDASKDLLINLDCDPKKPRCCRINLEHAVFIIITVDFLIRPFSIAKYQVLTTLLSTYVIYSSSPASYTVISSAEFLASFSRCE
jgi:hypothetical protein